MNTSDRNAIVDIIRGVGCIVLARWMMLSEWYLPMIVSVAYLFYGAYIFDRGCKNFASGGSA